jgi:hypothetical protein
MEREQKNNPQQNQENQDQENKKQKQNQIQDQNQPNTPYAGTTQGGQGAPAKDGAESSEGRNTTIDSGDERSIAGREDS